MTQWYVRLILTCDFSVLSSLDRSQLARMALVSVRTRGVRAERGTGYRVEQLGGPKK